MRINSRIVEQLRAAYRRVIAAAGWSPQPDVDALVASFWEQEEAHHDHLGCPDFRDRPALVLGVEGLHALCATDRRTALRLLEMAVTEIKATHPKPLDFHERVALLSRGAR
jgi:hypothetical protein